MLLTITLFAIYLVTLVIAYKSAPMQEDALA